MAKVMRMGGSFAPPLSDATLSQYDSVIAQTDPQSQVGDALRKLQVCAHQWWNQPESVGNSGRPHPSGRGVIVDLDENVQSALFDHIPWMEELNIYGDLFESLTGELRNVAHHLLWFAKELCLDREPITTDKL